MDDYEDVGDWDAGGDELEEGVVCDHGPEDMDAQGAGGAGQGGEGGQLDGVSFSRTEMFSC